MIGEELTMKNGLIVSIPIGHYQNNAKRAEVPGPVPDLPVESDVQNMKELADYLNYKFLTIENKMSWTEAEIMNFLSNRIGSEFFGDFGVPKHDGLIVAFSGHGIKDHIVTSDLKRMDRTAIHRYVSNAFPKIRDFPRVFLFDACDGSGDKVNVTVASSKTVDNTKGHKVADHSVAASELSEMSENQVELSPVSSEMTKNTQLADVQHDKEWISGNKNPDYGLTVVHASNKGFVAKMKGGSVGSYLTYFFTKSIIQNHKTMGLASMLEKINETLHSHGKQQLRTEFFSKTRNLRFEINVFE